MSTPDSLVLESAGRMFGDLCTDMVLAEADAGAWPERLWAAIEEFGLAAAMVPEEHGGFGIQAAEAFALLRLAGTAALPLPLAETMVANRLLALAGLPITSGPMTVALGPGLCLQRDGGNLRLTGTAVRVPWGRSAEIVAVASDADGSWLVRLGREGVAATPGANIAHEPRDRLEIGAALPADAAAQLPEGLTEPDVLAMLAATRCSQMSGAMARIAEISAGYALERHQFGRPIAKFQVIQQNLAVLAEQAAAATAAADLAAEAAEAKPVRRLAVAAAKTRAGEAAGQVAAIAHQVHGAMGFTQEFRLHHLTRRLWSWREEYGNETYWAQQLGSALAGAGAGGLWAAITAV